MTHLVSRLTSGVAVLRPTGKLNMVSAPAVGDQLTALLSAGSSRVVVDLVDVPFIDSSGLGMLVSGLKSARKAGGDLRIAAPNEQVRLVLRLTNMDRVLKPYPSAAAAF